MIIGEKTKNLVKFVRSELELTLKKDIPLIAVNLNDRRQCDDDRCLAVIRDEYVVHIPFKAKMLQYALDHFPAEHRRKRPECQRGKVLPRRCLPTVGTLNAKRMVSPPRNGVIDDRHMENRPSFCFVYLPGRQGGIWMEET